MSQRGGEQADPRGAAFMVPLVVDLCQQLRPVPPEVLEDEVDLSKSNGVIVEPVELLALLKPAGDVDVVGKENPEERVGKGLDEGGAGYDVRTGKARGGDSRERASRAVSSAAVRRRLP